LDVYDHMPAQGSERPKRKKHGGRQRGTLNKRTLAKIAEAKARAAEMAIGRHETPLDFMLAVMRMVELPLKARMQAAKDAAPYVHYRLVSNENLDAAMNADPERSSDEIRDDLRRLLTEMGVEPRIIEAIVGPRGEVKLLEDDGGAKH
jgi:hypothetical protein